MSNAQSNEIKEDSYNIEKSDENVGKEKKHQTSYAVALTHFFKVFSSTISHEYLFYLNFP